MHCLPVFNVRIFHGWEHFWLNLVFDFMNRNETSKPRAELVTFDWTVWFNNQNQSVVENMPSITCSSMKPLLIERDAHKTENIEPLGQGHLSSILITGPDPSNYGSSPAYQRDLKWWWGKLNSRCVTAVALCITALVHYLFLAQLSAIKRQGERCSMRSRHINSSLAERKWKPTREALGSANELRWQLSWNKPLDWIRETEINCLKPKDIK